MKLIVLILIETILFWLFSRGVDPSISIGLVFLLPAACVINLMLAAAVFFGKKPPNSWYLVFLINAVIAPVITYYAFSIAIAKTQKEEYDEWSFINSDTTYSILLAKKEQHFEISWRVGPGSSVVIKRGEFRKKKNEYMLLDSAGNFIISNNKLIGFRYKDDSIKLTVVGS